MKNPDDEGVSSHTGRVRGAIRPGPDRERLPRPVRRGGRREHRLIQRQSSRRLHEPHETRHPDRGSEDPKRVGTNRMGAARDSNVLRPPVSIIRSGFFARQQRLPLGREIFYNQAMQRLSLLRQEVVGSADPKQAKALARFFKTGIGEYGERDVFLGLTVPQARVIAQRYGDLGFADIARLLRSKFHEERLIALLILVEQFGREDEKTQEKIFHFYLGHTAFVNNWDLVDLSAPKIVGAFLLQGTSRRGSKNMATRRSRKILWKLVASKNLWERRISIVATMSFVRVGQFADTLALCEKLLYDTHDLIHKAVGWMLREVGKKDVSTLERFLKKNAARMPRTMLRYAIERFPEAVRRKYLEIVRFDRDPSTRSLRRLGYGGQVGMTKRSGST